LLRSLTLPQIAPQKKFSLTLACGKQLPILWTTMKRPPTDSSL